MLRWRAYWEGYGMCNTPATPRRGRGAGGFAGASSRAIQQGGGYQPGLTVQTFTWPHQTCIPATAGPWFMLAPRSMSQIPVELSTRFPTSTCFTPSTHTCQAASADTPGLLEFFACIR